MSLEQTIKDTIVSESYDLDGRLQQLVRAGLMPANTIPVLRKAISKVQGGMTLQGAERDVMANFINSMMFIVLGDDAIFNRARAGAKTYATEAKEKTEYDYEGDMAMGQLKSIIANSQRMHDMLSDDTNLPEWVQSKITLAEDYISTASNYMQGEMNEEQIDELSKKTLGSYVKKSKKELSSSDYHVGRAVGARETGGKSNFSPELERKLANRGKKRYHGIDKAVDKMMTKEEAEQIDEISKKTLGSYVKKASGAEQPKNVMSPKNVPLTKIAAYQGDSETGHFGSRFNQHTYDKAERLRKNRETGIKRAVDKLTKEDVELDEGNTTPEIKKAYADLIKTPSGSSERKTAIRHYKSLRQNLAKEEVEGLDEGSYKDNPRHMGTIGPITTDAERRERAKKYREKLAKEEVEQVDEVSKRTLGRYINKAKDSIDMTSYRSGIKDGTAISSSTPYKSNNPLEKKLSKRHKGIETAVKKLTKEDIDAAKSMNESYKNKFDAALEHYNIKSPSELGEDKRKEFFNHVDQEFKKGDN